MKKGYLYRLGICLVSLLGILCLSNCKAGGVKPKSARGLNLLVFTLDTMRADSLGAYGYQRAVTPNLDQLAQKGIMFANCYAPVPITFPAHCSIFTGNYPLAHQVRSNGLFFLNRDKETLAEKMKEQGYFTFAAVASFVLLAKFGLNQGFDIYDDSLNVDQMINNFESEITADQVYFKFSKWFKGRSKEKRFFAWVHFYDPHAPYEPPREYRKYGNSDAALYDGEVAYMDSYIGKIIDDLKSEGILDNTLIIAAGDHGEALGEHDEYGHAIFCYEENVRVPLIFSNPGLFKKAVKVKNRVNLIDIMPTILELYGMAGSPDLQGESLLDLFSGEEKEKQRTVYLESMYGKEEYGWAPLTAIIHENYKYISLPEPELYDLGKDTGEKNNLVWKKNRLARELDKKLLKLVASYSKKGLDSRRELTREDQDHLKSLGYISSFSEKSTQQQNLDPKKGIAFKNLYRNIKRDIKDGHLNKAEAELKKVVRENAENANIKTPDYFELLNQIYEKRKDLKSMERTFKEAIQTFPKNDAFKINFASFKIFHLKQYDEAEKICREVLEKNKKYTLAYIFLGRMAEHRDDIKKALDYFEKALQIEPKNVSLKVSYCQLLKEDNNFSKASELCLQLLADESVRNNTAIQAKLGILLTKMNRDDRALQVLNQVVSTAKDQDETNAEAWNYLGIIYSRKQDYKKSLEAYQRSVKLDPKIAKTYNNLGTLYLTLFLKKQEKQLHSKAVEAFDRALELDPELVSALNGRGSALTFANRVNEALRDWKKAIKIKPDFTEVYFNIGITYLQLKSNRQALKYLNICKEKFYNKLSVNEQNRLNRLINQAGG